MEQALSGRADTSAPASSDTPGTATPGSAAAGQPVDLPFVPNVFDLLTLAHRAELSVGSPALQLYLGSQAIDHSTHLGLGASFEVSCRDIPKSDGLEHESRLGGLTVTARQSEQTARTLVYKTAKIAFTVLGEPTDSDRKAMNSVLMEIYALTHPPLFKHPNIVTFLALGWGHNPYNISYRLPVVVVEYADHGSLAALQEKESLDSKTKLSLTLDIAEGLKVLHRCGIIHGDVKSENVLVFSDAQKRYLAKLADFGFSTVGEAAADLVHIGGTRPWKAPEAAVAVPRHLLTKTDVYSFGMTIWRIAMNGMDPFPILVGDLPQGCLLASEVERLKEGDRLKQKVGLDQWYLQWIIASQEQASGGSPVPQILPILQQTNLQVTGGTTASPQANHVLQWVLWVLHRHSQATSPLGQQLKQNLLVAASADEFYGRVSEMLEKCIGRDPLTRDLDGAIQALQGNTTPSVWLVPPHLLLAVKPTFYVPICRKWRIMDLYFE